MIEASWKIISVKKSALEPSGDKTAELRLWVCKTDQYVKMPIVMLAYFVRKCIYKAVNQSKSFTSIAWFCFAFKFCTNLLFLKGERVGNKTFVVPSV